MASIRPATAAGSVVIDRGSILGAVAVALVAINTFGGFLVTERMLEMFKKKERPNPPAGGRADNPPKGGQADRVKK